MCGVVAAREEREMPMVGEPTVEGASTYKSLMWKGNALKPGEGVFLTPGSAKFKIKQKAKEEVSSIKCEDVDEELWKVWNVNSENEAVMRLPSS